MLAWGRIVDNLGTDAHSILSFRSVEQFERYYNVTDKAMLAWDRIVGNLLEQAMPFLTLFWVNVGLAAIRVTDYRRVAVAGWVYVVFRSLYTVSALLSLHTSDI